MWLYVLYALYDLLIKYLKFQYLIYFIKKGRICIGWFQGNFYCKAFVKFKESLRLHENKSLIFDKHFDCRYNKMQYIILHKI